MNKYATSISVCILFLLEVTSCGSKYSSESEADIKKELLRDCPRGSSSGFVLGYLRRKTASEPRYDTNFKTDIGRSIPNQRHIPEMHYFYGAIFSTIATYEGYSFFVSTEVQTRWEFDAKDHLIDVTVIKQAVGP